MLWQLQDSVQSQTWSDQAVRDTITAIAQQPAYDRNIGESLWGRAVRWIADQLINLFDSVGGLPYGRIITVSLLVLALALIIARLVIGIRAERMAGHSVPRTGLSNRGQVLLSDAERLAANGDYTAAAHALFASLLAVGGSRGEFRVHPSKTTGDYVRDLRRRKTSWLRPFQAFRARYDRVIYGDMQCSADDYGALVQEVRVMLERERAA